MHTQITNIIGAEYPRMEPNNRGEVYVDPLPDLISEIQEYLRESIKKLLN